MLACQRHVRGARRVSLPAVSKTGIVTLAAILCYTWAYDGMKRMAIGFHGIATV